MMRLAPPYDARALANFFLELADQRGVELTQLMLYKLVYLCHGWYLATEGEPLISQTFEAWQYGPVVKVLRDQFSCFGKSKISGRATRLNIHDGTELVVAPLLAESDREFAVGIFDAYRRYSAWQLSDFTHEAGSPWDRVWNAEAPLGRLALSLSNAEIQKYFTGLPTKHLLS
jgi:uncharacterized phage-associated protein